MTAQDKNDKNDQLMRKLLKAPCGVQPVMKGDKGWEKHAVEYYKQKSKFASITEKKLKVRK